MGNLNKDFLQDRLKGTQFDQIIAIRPTGWAFGKSKKTKSLEEFKISNIKPIYFTSDIALLEIPYSEHSSFSELELFVKGLKKAKIIPTVDMQSKASQLRQKAILEKWGVDIVLEWPEKFPTIAENTNFT